MPSSSPEAHFLKVQVTFWVQRHIVLKSKPNYDNFFVDYLTVDLECKHTDHPSG